MRSDLGTCPPGTQLHVLHVGNFHIDLRRLAASAAFLQRRSAREPQDLWRACPVLVVLIIHPHGNFLFDTGCPPDWETRWARTGIDDIVAFDDWTEDQLLPARLAALGLDARDITAVIMSHLHMDHAGYLSLFEGGKTKVHVQASELDSALSIADPGEGPYVRTDYASADLAWNPLSGTSDVAAGIRAVPLPGHTHGNQGLHINLANSGQFLFAGDAAHLCLSLTDARAAPMNVADLHEWKSSIRQLQRFQQEGVTVVCGHDPDQAMSLKKSPDFYA